MKYFGIIIIAGMLLANITKTVANPLPTFSRNKVNFDEAEEKLRALRTLEDGIENLSIDFSRLEELLRADGMDGLLDNVGDFLPRGHTRRHFRLDHLNRPN